jgi:hypothetical protein
MRSKSFCKNGHEMSGSNTYRCKARPTRNQCRKCKVSWGRAHRRKHAQEASAKTREWRNRVGYRRVETDIVKKRARGLISTHIRRGKIVRPDHCWQCGLICIPHAHHSDYKQPLKIEWLCPICHAEKHHPLVEQEAKESAEIHRDMANSLDRQSGTL